MSEAFGISLSGTVGQGLIPSYRCGDLAGHVGFVLLIALRILQGIATGSLPVEASARSSLSAWRIMRAVGCTYDLPAEEPNLVLKCAARKVGK